MPEIKRFLWSGLSTISTITWGAETDFLQGLMRVFTVGLNPTLCANKFEILDF